MNNNRTYIVKHADGCLSFWNHRPSKENFQTGSELLSINSNATVQRLTEWAAQGYGEMETGSHTGQCIRQENWKDA